MAMLRKINRALSMLLILMALALLYSKTFRAHQPEKHSELRGNEASNRTVDDESESETDIPIVICAAEQRLGAAMATINSVYSNTRASVFFYIVTLRDAIKLTRQYIKKTKLKQIKYKILEFNPMALKGKVKPDTSRPDLLHPVSTYKRDFYTKLK
ncbi:glycosyltransferase 8 domain-containing protein 2 [Tachysurus ichikawai]